MNKPSYLNIEEMISLPTLADTNISDDGKNVAFVKRTADWDKNKYKSHVWIYEKANERTYPLTSTIESTNPLWSPDSQYIAYLSPVGAEGDKKNQIFVQSISSNRGIQVTDESEGVSSFKWAPTGKGFYFIAQQNESYVIKNRKERYGNFHIGGECRNSCLYYIGIEKEGHSDKNSRVGDQLMGGDNFHILEFDISNDGGKAVFMAAPSSNMADYINGALYLLNFQSGELQKIATDKLLGGSVCFSPDDSKVCYLASIKEKAYYQTHIQDSTLEIYDSNNGEFMQPLKDFDRTVTPIRWTEKGILISWQDKTNYLIGLFSEDESVELLGENADCFVMDASITSDGNYVSAIKATTNENFEVYLDDRKITNENRFFKGKYKSNREIISWQSSDGLEIEGVLSTPVDFDRHRKYPLLVVIHGGPAWAAFPIFSGCLNEKYPIEPFIEKGFIVLEPNYRGSSGYGNAFLTANYRKLGIADYDDVRAGVDHLVDLGIADQDRVGMMGWSNGGYISAFCATFSSRFKAISVGGGITNWHTHYANTDIPYYIKMYLGDDPWNDPEIYTATSPMTYIKSACTPTLIQHGEKDARIPISNAYELYQGLKDMGVDTELIIFKDMAYASNQPGVNVAIMKQNLMWFSHYILG